jgi:hypothetical protein
LNVAYDPGLCHEFAVASNTHFGISRQAALKRMFGPLKKFCLTFSLEITSASITIKRGDGFTDSPFLLTKGMIGLSYV